MKKAVGSCTARCTMLLFCAKTVMRELHNFELARPSEGCFFTTLYLLVQEKHLKKAGAVSGNPLCHGQCVFVISRTVSDSQCVSLPCAS